MLIDHVDSDLIVADSAGDAKDLCFYDTILLHYHGRNKDQGTLSLTLVGIVMTTLIIPQLLPLEKICSLPCRTLLNESLFEIL